MMELMPAHYRRGVERIGFFEETMPFPNRAFADGKIRSRRRRPTIPSPGQIISEPWSQSFQRCCGVVAVRWRTSSGSRSDQEAWRFRGGRPDGVATRVPEGAREGFQCDAGSYGAAFWPLAGCAAASQQAADRAYPTAYQGKPIGSLIDR